VTCLAESIESRIDGLADVPGWTPREELIALFCLAYASAGIKGDIVEIGSWCGRSSALLGIAARTTGSSIVHCVDLFPQMEDWHRNGDGSYSISVTIGNQVFRACDEQTVWAEPFEATIAPLYRQRPGILDFFNETIASNGLADTVKAHRGTSATFCAAAPEHFKCRLAFIDGDHGFSAVRDDIRNISRLLVPGGFLCMDDAFCGNPGVDRAIEQEILNSEKYELQQQFTRKLFVARKK
jgi:predicted O-methyltransferase YrrM